MTGIQLLACLWTLFITQAGFVFSDVQFLQRNEGDSVVFPCVLEQRNPPPFSVYLKRSWLHPSEMLFMYTNTDFSVDKDDDKKRISVSGDPSSHSLNVSVSQLSSSDTDRYYCEFLVDSLYSEDVRIRGTTEFFLLVNAAASGSMDVGLVETCPGGSAVLPCLPPPGEALAVEGVILHRQKSREPVEVLYHSQRHHGSSPFPVERVQLSTAPGPRGISYNLTLLQLQPDDSALYSCQLILRGRSQISSSLGTQVFFVSVQGGQCSCSSYSTLLYALSAAVAVLLLLLLGFVVMYKGKAGRRVTSRPQPPIYEEMTGLQPVSRKLGPCHLEEMETSEYRNCPAKKPCPENHYERPSGALRPRNESQKP